MGRKKSEKNYAINFKHEVCQYYEHHTQKETIEMYGVSAVSIWKWRVALGYRNKHRGYNPHMQHIQPVVPTQQTRDFMVTRDENGKLRADLAEITQKYVALEQQFTEFKSKIMEALQ